MGLRAQVQIVDVNGGPGALVLDGRLRLIGVWALDIADCQITSISVVVNPDRRTKSSTWASDG